MRRADRLFLLIQVLRRERTVTAEALALELEVSVRTIYRDVADLLRCGVPVEGEAGVGYALRQGFELPPLMFSAEEVEALVFGSRLVERFSDERLARSARDVLAKVDAVLPDELRARLARTPYFAPGPFEQEPGAPWMGELREAIDGRRCVHIRYTDDASRATERVLQPLGLFFWGRTWTLTAWCRLRDGFRNFRLDRIRDLEVTAERFDVEDGRELDDFLRTCASD